MFLRNPFAGAFGLDIGDLSVKLIQLERRTTLKRERHFELKELRAMRLPPGLIVNGEIQEPETVRKKLLNLLGKEGTLKPIRAPWVVAGLPEPKTFLKLIEVEGGDNELTAVDVSYHAKRHLPFELQETYLDWQTVKKATASSPALVLIGAAPKVIADSYTYLLESVGLAPIALEIEAITLARSLITAKKDYTGQARAILDLGATRSSIIIYDNNSIQFSTTLNFSGEIVNTALMQELRLDHAEAENLKIKNGISYDSNCPRYLKIASDLAESLVPQIKQAFSFYREHFKAANPVTHITMCGGMTNWNKLDAFISQKLKVPSRPGHPWKNLFNPALSNQDPKKAQTLASAIGLALRAAQNPLEDRAL